MTTGAAITPETNLQDPTRTVRVQRQLTLAQEQIVREFTTTYDLERHQISFDGEHAEPIFDYDALSILSLTLAPDIVSMIAERGTVDPRDGIADASCVVELRDGRSRTVFGTAFVGEEMFDGNKIEDFRQALDVAQARAARRGLRACGFNAVKAHQKARAGETLELNLEEVKDVRAADLALIHVLARECGYITGTGDDESYRDLIHSLFPDLVEPSAAHMNEKQRAYFITTLRSLKGARQRAHEPHPALAANANAAAVRR
jgi:hypothetical protein